ncbi:hypothetical protein FBUS_09319 [Fasciolopsis buskii]|uniref:Uncharacterized protein n=1 Tax=Fasciolopsis buskii TaxID=27845 RepID=A0A8E0VFC0_9TREM|nr:hypothetical protein FBUS_09319 [Fasciolopsis buski]
MDGMSELSQDDSETEIASSVVSTRRPMGLIGLLCEVCCSIVLVCGIGLIVTAISLTETLFKYTDPFDTGLAPYTVTVGILGCLVLIASVFGIAAMFTEDQFLLFLVRTTVILTNADHFSIIIFICLV